MHQGTLSESPPPSRSSPPLPALVHGDGLAIPPRTPPLADFEAKGSSDTLPRTDSHAECYKFCPEIVSIFQ